MSSTEDPVLIILSTVNKKVNRDYYQGASAIVNGSINKRHNAFYCVRVSFAFLLTGL